MEIFSLNKNTSTKEFKCNSSDSYLRIISISLLQEDNSTSNWFQLISKLQIKAQLKYVVYADPAGRYIDDRQLEYLIDIPIDPNQIQPVFNVNKIIKTESLKIGSDSIEKYYTQLKIELIENSPINENYSLQIVFDKFNLDEI